jgi:hypothetical protein
MYRTGTGTLCTVPVRYVPYRTGTSALPVMVMLSFIIFCTGIAKTELQFLGLSQSTDASDFSEKIGLKVQLSNYGTGMKHVSTVD